MADQATPFASLRTPTTPFPAASLDALKAQEITQADATQRVKDATTLGEKIGAGAVTGTIGAIDRFAQNFKYAPDPAWIGKPVEDEAKLWETNGLGDYLPLLEKAVSKDHADELYGAALAEKNANRHAPSGYGRHGRRQHRDDALRCGETVHAVPSLHDDLVHRSHAQCAAHA